MYYINTYVRKIRQRDVSVIGISTYVIISYKFYSFFYPDNVSKYAWNKRVWKSASYFSRLRRLKKKRIVECVLNFIYLINIKIFMFRRLKRSVLF